VDLRTGARTMEVRHLTEGQTPSPLLIGERKPFPGSGFEFSVLVERARDGFATGAGLGVAGSSFDAAHLPEGGSLEPAYADDAVHLEAPPNPTSALVQVGSGRNWLLSAVLPGYLGLHLTDPRGTLQLLYVPIDRRMDLGTATVESDMLARAAEACDQGWKQVATDPDSPVAQHLSNEAVPPNPTLALLAAYDHARTGNTKAVRHLIDRFTDEQGWVPFDLVLLLMGPVGDETLQRVVPRYPLMTAGWSLPFPGQSPPWMERVRSALRPVPWTTADFNASGPDLPSHL